MRSRNSISSFSVQVHESSHAASLGRGRHGLTSCSSSITLVASTAFDGFTRFVVTIGVLTAAFGAYFLLIVGESLIAMAICCKEVRRRRCGGHPCHRMRLDSFASS